MANTVSLLFLQPLAVHTDNLLGYMGAESGVSFNSAVRSWILKMVVQKNNMDRDKIPSMIKVILPAAKSPLTTLASPGHPPELPPRDILSACAARYFEQVHCLYWLYSSEDFYTRLESTYSGDYKQQTGSWLCSLHSIVALCVLCEPSPNSLADGQLVHDSLETAKSLVSRVCDEADLDSVRALIVVVSNVGGVSPVHLGGPFLTVVNSS